MASVSRRRVFAAHAVVEYGEHHVPFGEQHGGEQQRIAPHGCEYRRDGGGWH